MDSVIRKTTVSKFQLVLSENYDQSELEVLVYKFGFYRAFIPVDSISDYAVKFEKATRKKSDFYMPHGLLIFDKNEAHLNKNLERFLITSIENYFLENETAMLKMFILGNFNERGDVKNDRYKYMNNLILESDISKHRILADFQKSDYEFKHTDKLTGETYILNEENFSSRQDFLREVYDEKFQRVIIKKSSLKW